MERYAGEFLIFLATIDPVSTLALFVGLTATVSAQDRTKIALRSVGYSAVILVGFIILGQLLLGSLGIRLASFQLAGGIIFFLFGVQMVFGSGAAGPSASAEPGHDIAIFPLAVPSIAGPGSILSAVILTDNKPGVLYRRAGDFDLAPARGTRHHPDSAAPGESDPRSDRQRGIHSRGTGSRSDSRSACGRDGSRGG